MGALYETVEQGAQMHGVDVDALVKDLQEQAAKKKK